MLELVRTVILWSLCLVYSSVAAFRLIFTYVKDFSAQPWTPKDRPTAPPALSDPKYGTHKFATVNGIRLHYVEAGDRSKPLMIFVHGFPEFWYCWRHQITEFSKDYWTVAIDMRGYNLSEKPVGVQNYSIQYIVDDLRALIEHLDRKKVILVAHDWGALVGWQFISQNQNMVYKYVMMGAPSRRVFKRLFNLSMDQFKRSWYVIYFQMPILPELTMKVNDFGTFDDVWGNDFNEDFTQDDLEAYKYVFSQPGALTAGINYYRANFGASPSLGLKSDGLDGSDGMYVLGEFEKYISKETLKVTKEEYPKIRVETVAGASHFLQQHRAQATNDLLRDFFGTAAVDCPVDPIN